MIEKLRIRLYVNQDLLRNVMLTIDLAQTHYLKNVMRKKEGDLISLFNGRDGEWLATINTLGNKKGTLVVRSLSRKQSYESDIWLLFAPVKRTRQDYLVQKACELGATAILPVKTRHTIVRRLNLARLRANVVEAAEQCGRLTVPQVESMLPLMQMVDTWPQNRRLILCAESGPATPIVELFRNQKAVGPWAILIGPEGGFDKSELDQLTNLPFVSVASLGPRLLRSDTAAISALACWQAMLGDWKKLRLDL